MGLLDKMLTIGSMLAALTFIALEFLTESEVHIGILVLGLLVILYSFRELRMSSDR